mgnify:CR=1 FL=1
MKTMLKRGAGVLMPIFSLPSPYGIGTFGRASYEFIDQLKRGRQTYWQVLPMGPTCYGDSPYQSYSAFAGNPYFIDLDTLKDEKLLTQDEIDACWWCDKQDQVKYDALYYYRFPLLRKAYERSSHKESEEYQAFLEENEEWLDDYALYMAVKGKYEGKSWMDWDEDIRFRRPEALSACREELAEEINYWKFLQFKFFEQWKKLKQYAKEKELQIVGDIPIYVALDSADVWSHPELFQLDEENLTPLKVSGVPPDAFSEDGQLWGNPLYDWEKMKQTDFAWWRSRMKASAKLYDAVRIDHFIGVVQYYAIPYGAVTAKDGEWEKGPGKKLTDALDEAAGETKIIAEDLGVFCQEVKDLLAYLKTIDNARDDLAVRRIINVPKRGIGATTLNRVSDYAEAYDISFYESLKRAEEIPSLGKSAAKIKPFVTFIQTMRSKLPYIGVADLLREVIEETGYVKELEAEGTDEAEARIENIDELLSKVVAYEEGEEQPTLSGFLEEVALVADIDSVGEENDYVVLMTLHSAKGLEFPKVFLAGMEDGLFPGYMSITSDNASSELEEERRLAYVGITRAMKELVITSARQRMVRGETQYNKVSRFVKEIPPELLNGEIKKPAYLENRERHTAEPVKKKRPTMRDQLSGQSMQARAFSSVHTEGGSLSYGVGDRVSHMKFGEGTVKAIVPGGRDFEVTVDFDAAGTKKMFAAFAKLKKV